MSCVIREITYTTLSSNIVLSLQLYDRQECLCKYPSEHNAWESITPHLSLGVDSVKVTRAGGAEV